MKPEEYFKQDDNPSTQIVCITHPPLKYYARNGEIGATYNLDAYCNCGRQYKEHESWILWALKNKIQL